MYNLIIHLKKERYINAKLIYFHQTNKKGCKNAAFFHKECHI